MSVSATSTATATATAVKTPPKETLASDAGHSQFFWTYTEEPHRPRRQGIITTRPEITKLCGPEPLTKYHVALVVAIQVFAAWALRNTHPLDWRFLVTA